ncbi:MAG: DUF4230 domain-containing protein [Prevotella sp.]|nr:DUF4230 domain-containing protein [Prevotella sp.]
MAEDIIDKIFRHLGRLILLLVICGLAVVALLVWLGTGNSIETAQTAPKTTISPTIVTEIRQIGQWEFLTIEDEEMVDTVKHGIFKDEELIRIYNGKLRLGVDLTQADPRWIEMKDDSLIITLPKITLLDKDFIDEAMTQPFFQSGDWTDADYESLYQRAYQRMKARCMTKENMRIAEDNARSEMENLFRSMGYDKLRIKL